jgi:hypothetical protein
MMDRTYWHQQTKDEPLFGDMLWSRPENRRHAGKLLVLGGNAHGFSAPAAIYSEAGKAGVGTCRVLLPEALHKTIGQLFPAAEYAASTATSGGFARAALDEWLSQSAWADGVILAGDFGRNSETAILIENYLGKYGSQLTLVNDAVDYALDTPELFLLRPNTTLVLTIAQLQKLATAAKFPTAVTSSMALLQLADLLYRFSQQYEANIITYHDGVLLVAADGQVSSTRNHDAALATAAAHAAVWWLQNPTKPFEAMTTSLVAT